VVERPATLRLGTFDIAVARTSGRLDSKHLFSALEKPARVIGDGERTVSALGTLAQPSRFKRVYATSEEERIPYLRPYDIFDYLPRPADFLSKARSDNLKQLMALPGTILQTCSGRNLGPAVLVDEYLAGFAFSHDLVRVWIDEPDVRLLALAYLRTRQGMGAMTMDRTGSVIDHLTSEQVGSVVIPVIDARDAAQAVRQMRRASRLRSLARRRLNSLQLRIEDHVPLPTPPKLSDGFVVSSTLLRGRVDAAFHDPFVATIRSTLRASGAVAIGDIAEVRKPGGRYSPRYVAPQYGQPLLSGRQILQWHPIALKHVAEATFADAARYRLAAGTIVYQADGRAEEGLGTPAVVTEARDGWLASGHVGRIVAREGVSWGRIYLGLATRHGQAQIRAAASGSVVDSTFESDMAEVLIPEVSGAAAASAERAWRAMSSADALEREATRTVEAGLGSPSAMAGHHSKSKSEA
jgi:hypothetical protein